VLRALAISLLCAPNLFAWVDNAEINLTDRQAVSLAGFWKFRANSVERMLRIEKEWRLQEIQHVSNARFELKLRIPAFLRTDDFALMLPPVSASINISFNGKLIKTKGKVSDQLRYPENSSEAFAWYPIKRELLNDDEFQTLTLDITGFQGGGGIYGNSHIYFGGIEEIQNRFNRIFLLNVFLAAAIFMIATFHFALVRAPNSRRANLHYVLLSLAMAAHILGMNGIGYYIFDNFVFNAALIHLLVAAFPFSLVGFSQRYFKLRFPLVRRAAYWFAAAMSLVLITVAVFPQTIPAYLAYGLPTGVVAMALALAFAIFAAIRGVLARREGSGLVLAGFLTYGATVINDVVFYYFYVTPFKMADIGFLVAVICIALALAGRLERAAKEKHELIEWQKEISLAAQIQKLALPAKMIDTQRLKISALFKPMKIIGGDFFAFYENADRGVGIFIADVSGHGIAAALTVNLIKSVFTQQHENAVHPALLMRNMNAALFPHLHEQFITAAYCYLDFERKKIIIAQAGHPPIYLIRRDSATLERAKPRGRFFGFESHLEFEETELDLALYSRIFLYSDGVIEAGALKGLPFGQGRLEKLLIDLAELSGEAVLSQIEHEVAAYVHSALNTDDDSSIIIADLRA